MALRLCSLRLWTAWLPGSPHRFFSLTASAGQSAAQATSFLYTPEHHAIRESLRKVYLNSNSHIRVKYKDNPNPNTNASYNLKLEDKAEKSYCNFNKMRQERSELLGNVKGRKKTWKCQFNYIL
uniref:Uncharacterized protein n=1 Tax=Pyxicephalus adspersus TaxID=30357 RepID=A0AAV3AQU6_PYXAD|nr:TPA: hypothetical protein GDO54_012798 [Pyxicephalus adspersus]